MKMDKLYEETEEEHRKLFEKWNKALEENNKKTDEIVNKIFKRLDAEETDQNFSN